MFLPDSHCNADLAAGLSRWCMHREARQLAEPPVYPIYLHFVRAACSPWVVRGRMVGISGVPREIPEAQSHRLNVPCAGITT
jgi:hypothetical protein